MKTYINSRWISNLNIKSTAKNISEEKCRKDSKSVTYKEKKWYIIILKLKPFIHQNTSLRE